MGTRSEGKSGPATGPRRLSLVSGFELADGARSVPLSMAHQRLVALLGLQRGAITRVRVAATLWPDRSDRRAGANLRSLLFRFPREGGILEQRTDRLSLAADVACDVHEFVAYAHRLLHPEGDGAVTLDLDCVPLTHDLLPGWYDEWVIIERERLHQLRLHALDELCRRLSASGRHGEAVEAGLASVLAEPLRESGQQCLIVSFLAEGNPGQARMQYDRYAALLEEELGCAPSERLRALVGGARTVTRL